MTSAETVQFLQEERTITCATNGWRGWPHLMPLWYVVRLGDVWASTYARSQKVCNLQRDPRVTLQVEAGETYAELRGVMIEARVMVFTDLDIVTELGLAVLRRYSGEHARPNEMERVVREQASKRVALQFVPVRITSFDHRKIGPDNPRG